MECTVINPTTSNNAQKVPNANCGMQSQIFQNFYSKNSNFRPFPGQNTVTTTLKEIRLRVIVVTNPNYASVPQFQDNPTDRSTIKAIVEDWTNYASVNNHYAGLRTLMAPTKPNPSNCTTCHIGDSKLQTKLVDIQFINHNDNNYSPIVINLGTSRNDSILNVFFVQHNMDGSPAVSSTQGRADIGKEFELSSFNVTGNHTILLSAPKINSWDSYWLFIHELGHILGLWHLYNDDPYQDECTEIGQSSPDWLSDIFPQNLCVINSEFRCDPLADLAPLNDTSCTGNFMGKGFRYLSPMQLGRMHRMAYLGSSSRYVFPTEAPDVHPMEITSNQTWDFGIRMYQDIIVKAGKTLTITCEVQMPPRGKIIVEKGAKLVLDGGVISSYHPKASWKGIELYGDKNAQPIPTNQGRLEMKNNSLIEYAELAVQDFITNVWNGGGIINVTNSTFKDCRRAVALNDYPNYARGTSCSFFNVNFINEDANAITNQNLTGVGVFTSYNEKGVLIANSTFKNKLALNGTIPIENSNYAVYTNDAGFRITNSIFKGYKVGVTTMTVNNNPSRSTKILNCTFDSLFTGIMFADNFSMAQNNTFDHLLGYFDGIKDYAQFGQAIYAHNPNGLLINKNTINATYGNSIRGITVNDSRYFGSKVVDNTINNIYAGVITQRRNPQLDILCNHFTNGYYNIWGNPESNHPFFTLKDQGNGCGYFDYRAGNTFEGSATYHIYSNLYPTWNYFYFSNDISQIPTNTFGVSVNPDGCTNLTDATDPNSQCNLPSNTESWIDSLFDEAYTSWPENILGQTTISGQMQLAFIMQRLSERGSTDSIISFLENVNNLESQKLLLSLYLEQGNYTAFDNLLESISFSNGDETLAFKDYNNFLKTLSQENRTLFQLNLTEKELLETIATQDFEVSNYAKAMLEFVFMQEWEHYQERLPQEGQMAKYGDFNSKNQSSLGNAIPNPNTGKVRINVNILEKDAQFATLNIYDLTGRLILSKILQSGQQSISFDLSSYNNGLYLYSLNINGKNKATKKLVLQK
ncbi:MAG TPA: T9SS type A sorting domain-containing protein [Edaphocola sp.]|nr:T9SS type A sorting domain-containing protein [Edaphocola sp.]